MGVRDAAEDEQILDGGEILTCTFATIDMLHHAVAAELGQDDGSAYGLGPATTARVMAAAPAE